jgi:hypothetical protein
VRAVGEAALPVVLRICGTVATTGGFHYRCLTVRCRQDVLDAVIARLETNEGVRAGADRRETRRCQARRGLVSWHDNVLGEGASGLAPPRRASWRLRASVNELSRTALPACYIYSAIQMARYREWPR